MPVKIKLKELSGTGVSKDKTGIVTAGNQNLFNKLNETNELFYELEPLEVLNVCLQEEDLPINNETGLPDYTYYGGIRGRFLISEDNLNISNCKFYRPLMPDIQKVPVAGEVVYGYVDGSNRYYLGFVHLNNSVTNMGRPGISNLTDNSANIPNSTDTWHRSPMVNPDKYKPGYYYKENLNIKRPVMFVGDTLVNGRHGQIIRLGSNQVDEKELSPSIKITNGSTGLIGDNLSSENPNTDLSSINMTFNETIDIELPMTPKKIEDIVDYDKSQIQIRSDRLIFTSRNDSIGLYSNNNVEISSVNEIFVDSPNLSITHDSTKIGSRDAQEPQVLGQTLYDKLEALVTAIGGVTGIPTPTGPTPGPVSAAPNWSSVTSALSAVKDALSEKHRIDK